MLSNGTFSSAVAGEGGVSGSAGAFAGSMTGGDTGITSGGCDGVTGGIVSGRTSVGLGGSVFSPIGVEESAGVTDGVGNGCDKAGVAGSEPGAAAISEGATDFSAVPSAATPGFGASAVFVSALLSSFDCEMERAFVGFCAISVGVDGATRSR